MMAAPVLAGEHAHHPAACVPSAPPFDSHAFYASSSGGGGANMKELWENDVIAAEKWEDPQVRQPQRLLELPPVGRTASFALASAYAVPQGLRVVCMVKLLCLLSSHGLHVTDSCCGIYISRKKRRTTSVLCAGAYLLPLCLIAWGHP